MLSQAEIDSVKFIDVENYDETTDRYFGLGITDLTGIKNFKNLNGLLCRNNQLTKLDVSGCTKLSTLCCDNNQLTEAGKLRVKPPHLADVQFEVLMDDAPLAEGSRVPQGKVFRVNVLSPDLDVGETYVAELVSDSDSLKFPAKEGERFIVVDTGAVPGGTYSVRVTVSAPDYDETKSLTGVGFTLLALETPKVSVNEKDRRLNHGDTADIRVENADLGLGERYRLELYTGEGEAERVAAAFDWDPATRAFHLETADICGRESCMSEWHATRASMAGSCAPSTTLRARCAPRFSKR